MLNPKIEVHTVTQLTRLIKGMLETQVGEVWVSGEISNWSRASSGHAYFTIKDDSSQLDAVMFKGRLARLRFEPENGLEILARGGITVYERRGQYQLVVEELQPKGLGALQLAYEKLKKKLMAEGLFDEKHKKPLPLLPRRIGIVTSPTGAAIHDILQVLRRRFANVHILLYPAKVQGPGAAAEIAEGIRVLDAWGVDVMIVGRGGGSLEDLWAFNEEAVARAIFAARTPIISAVGHEVDVALSDFVADLRAPTPSAAAEMVVREHQALAEQVQQNRHRLERAMRRLTEQSRNRLDRYGKHYLFSRPETLFRQQRQYLDEMRERLERVGGETVRACRTRLDKGTRALKLLSPQVRLEHQKARAAMLAVRLRRQGTGLAAAHRIRLTPLAARLNSLSPLAVLSRGYALAWKGPERTLIQRAEQVRPQDEISVWFASGEITATVNQINEQGGMEHYGSRKET